MKANSFDTMIILSLLLPATSAFEVSLKPNRVTTKLSAWSLPGSESRAGNEVYFSSLNWYQDVGNPTVRVRRYEDRIEDYV